MNHKRRAPGAISRFIEQGSVMPIFGFAKTVKRPTVVVADDNEHCLNQICSLLEGSFDIVGKANNGLGCVDAVRRLSPSAAIVDISMPDITGIEAARRITHLNPKVKVVMLSVYEDAAFIEAALDAGAAAYVIKLRAFEDLVPTVQKALGSSAHYSHLKPVSR